MMINLHKITQRLLEFKRSKLDQSLKKCTFYAKNVIRRLSLSISSHFGAIYS